MMVITREKKRGGESPFRGNGRFVGEKRGEGGYHLLSPGCKKKKKKEGGGASSNLRTKQTPGGKESKS